MTILRIYKKPMAKILYLEIDEEITSVVSRIKEVKDKAIYVVAPRSANVTSSLVNLKLLKKEVDKHKKSINLVTQDSVARNLAQEVGIKTYAKIDKNIVDLEEVPNVHNYSGDEDFAKNDEKISGEEVRSDDGDFVNQKSKIKNQNDNLKDKEPEGFVHKKLNENIKKDNQPKIKSSDYKPAILSGSKKKVKKIILIGAIILTLFAAFFACFILLPKAEVKIVLKSERVENDFDLDIDKNAAGLNIENSTIPGTEVTTTSKDESSAKATGAKDVGQKANGKIVITNKTGIARSFVTSTNFKASNGLIFKSNSAFTAPAATLNEIGDPVYGTKIVDVSASDTGDNYNIGAGSFSIIGLSTDLTSKITAVSSVVMSGGYKKTITIVSQSDYDTARDKLKTDLVKKAKEDLKTKLKDGYTYSEDALITEEANAKSTPNVGEEAGDFMVNLEIKATALSYKTTDYQEIVKANFEKAVSDQEKVLVQSNMTNIKQKLVKNDISKTGILTVNVYGTMWAAPKIDNQKITDTLSGKTKEDSLSYLKSYKEIQSSKIDLWPFWVKSIPMIEKRIQVNIEYTQTGDQKNQTTNTTQESDSTATQSSSPSDANQTINQ